MTKLRLSTAALAVGLMAMAAPALAQQTVTPKSGPDINQPKIVPNSDSRMPSTSGAGTNRDNLNTTGGGGEAGGSSGSAGASGNDASGTGGGSGASGAGSGGPGGSGGSQ